MPPSIITETEWGMWISSWGMTAEHAAFPVDDKWHVYKRLELLAVVDTKDEARGLLKLLVS